MRNISERQKGLVTGLLMCLSYLLFYYILKKPLQGQADYAAFGIFILGIAWALIDYSRRHRDSTFKLYFNAGFKTFILATLIIVFFMALINFINPGIRDSIISQNNQLLMQEGSRTTAEIEENAAKFRSLYLPFLLIGTLIKFLVLGSIVTLIGAGFLSRDTARS